MFKRIKNLLDISWYTVEELRTLIKDTNIKDNYLYKTKDGEKIELSSTPIRHEARIIEIKTNDPFNEFKHDSNQ